MSWRAYLRQQRLPHGVAHPLVNINGLLTVEHVERLVLLFRCFEARNGNREPLAQEVWNRCLGALTPEKISELANRHGFEPTHGDAHQKVFFASSDDHGGVHPGATFTEVAQGEGVHDFFAGLMKGRATLHGTAGDPLMFSSSLYTTVFSYARDKIKRGAPVGANLLGKMAERFLAGQNPTAFSFAERFGHLTEAIRTGQALDFMKPGETTFAREVGTFLSDPKLKQALDDIIAREPNAQRRSFRMASHITNELSYRLITQFQRRLTKGNLIDAFQSLTGLLPVGGSVVPYLVAFGQQAPDRALLTHVARRFTGTVAAAAAQREARVVYGYAGGRERRGADHPRDDQGGGRCRRGPDRGHVAAEDFHHRHSDHEFPAGRRVRNPGVRAAEAELPAVPRHARLCAARALHRDHHQHAGGPIGLCALGAASCSACARRGFITPISRSTRAFSAMMRSWSRWSGITCSGSTARPTCST